MDDVARMAPGDRRDLFTEAAAIRGNIGPGVMEKDFWVCWTLKHIFDLGPAPAQLIFKGGTSLSKVYNLIERFSEDIDLSLSRESLGFVGERDPYQAPSNKRKMKLVDEIQERCREVILAELLPKLHARFESILGPGDAATPWTLMPDENEPQIVRFAYPAGTAAGGKREADLYVRRIVVLELGARSDHWPAEEHVVRPYAAEALPELFKQADCPVRSLSAGRTFWEKVTLLHALAHKPMDTPIGDRMSRHYYDVAKIYQSPLGPPAMAKRPLLDQVVIHKRLFFRSAWANYETAKPGTFKLVPPPERLAPLKADYRAMQENMIFGESDSFEELMAVIGRIELKLNAKA